jgi:chromosome segregation ATPase
MALRQLIVCVALVSASGQATSAIAANQSSIDKVVTLITEMKETCIKDADADKEAYDKYNCWCITTEEEKKAAIEAATAKIEELTAFLEEAMAKEAELKTEIKALEEDIAKDKDALETAKANREKENEEFLAEQADMKETLKLLAEAIGVLQKVQSVLVQKKTGHPSAQLALMQVKKLVQRIPPQFHSVLQKDLYDMLGALEDVEEEHLGSVFLPRSNAAALEQSWKRMGHRDLPWLKTSEQIGKEANPNDLKGMAAGAKSYNAQSGQILGILKAMGDNIAKELGTAQKEELNAEIAFQNLQGAKLAEIAAAEKQKKEKEAELADLLFKFSQAKRDLKNTEAQKEADEKFLAEMLKGCKKEDEDYAKRSKIRAEEIVAISETLEILTGDEARSLFDKTISFLQLGAVSQSKMAAQERAKTSAMKKILAAAKKSKNWALASLAVQVRLDAFTKVKKAMDVMLADLKAEQKAEYEKHTECEKDLDKTEDEIKEATNTKEDLDMKHEELKTAIKTLTDEITALNKEVSEMEVQLKEAGIQRKAENELFQQAIADQRATVRILQMAMNRLKKFYTAGTKFVDIHHHAPPPPKSSVTNSYEINANSGGVMQLLSTIIADAEGQESALHITEQNQQKNYAEFAAMTTETIETDRKAIAEKTEQKSTAEGELSETEESQLANDAAIAKLEELLSAIHTDCDWLIKYFDIRQKSRAAEMDAIEEAKAILSGADFS